MPKLSETLAGQQTERRSRLAEYFKKKDADGRLDVTDAERAQMKSLSDEINAEEPKFQKARADEAAEEANDAALKSLREVIIPPGFHGSGGQGGNAHQSFLYGNVKGHDGVILGRDGRPVHGLGDLFVGSKAYKSFIDEKKKGLEPSSRIEANGVDASIKTLFSRTAGYDPFVTRQPGIVLSAQQMPRVVDLIPQAETTQAAIRWMLETLYTNNASETTEGSAYGEDAFQYTEQSSPVQKIAAFLPITDEALADTPGLLDTLNGRVELTLKQRLDKQLMQGSGVAPYLKGFLNGGIGTQAFVNTDSFADALYKAIVGIQVNAFTDPSGIIMNPLDWQVVRLSKNSQGTYLFGTPDSEVAQRMWGLPVVTTTYCPQGTALVGDFVMYCQLFMRAGIDFLVSNSHQDYFAKGIQALRAQMRAAFIITRPSAFTKVALA